MKYVDYSIKLSPYRQFCCPLSLIPALSFAYIPVSPRFFGEFEPDMLTFSARHFEKPLIPSSTQPTRKIGGFSLVGCVELGMKRTGNEWFFKMASGESKHIELTEELGRNRDICRR